MIFEAKTDDTLGTRAPKQHGTFLISLKSMGLGGASLFRIAFVIPLKLDKENRISSGRINPSPIQFSQDKAVNQWETHSCGGALTQEIVF